MRGTERRVLAAVSVSGPIERTTRAPGRALRRGGRGGRATPSRPRSGVDRRADAGGHRHRDQLGPPGRGPGRGRRPLRDPRPGEGHGPPRLRRRGDEAAGRRRRRPGGGGPGPPAGHRRGPRRVGPGGGHQRRAGGREPPRLPAPGARSRPASASRSSPASRRPASSTSACCRPCPCTTAGSLVVDIGGGSTEIVLGERDEALVARSLKLGAIRLTDRFFPDDSDQGQGRDPLPPPHPGRASPRCSGRSTASTSPWPARARPQSVAAMALAARGAGPGPDPQPGRDHHGRAGRGGRRPRSPPRRCRSGAASPGSTPRGPTSSWPGPWSSRRCWPPSGHRGDDLGVTPCGRASWPTPTGARTAARCTTCATSAGAACCTWPS